MKIRSKQQKPGPQQKQVNTLKLIQIENAISSDENLILIDLSTLDEIAKKCIFNKQTEKPIKNNLLH